MHCFWVTVCKMVLPILSDCCLSVYPVLSVTLVYYGQTVGWIKTKLATEVGLGPGHNALDGDPAPPPPKRHSPHFSAHICCGQTAVWIKMPLGKEVGLGPGDILSHGDPAPPPQKGGTAPNYWPMSMVAKRLDGSRCHLV